MVAVSLSVDSSMLAMSGQPTAHALHPVWPGSVAHFQVAT